MDDDQIETLKLLVKKLKQMKDGRYVGWLNDRCVTTHAEGPMGRKDCFREISKVYSVGEREDEPAANLDDGKGGYVALWACEATEFVLISPLFTTVPETESVD